MRHRRRHDDHAFARARRPYRRLSPFPRNRLGTRAASAGRALREGQEPRMMVIACSDSRVDPAQIFDVDPGEIFVVRNVAAMVPPFETTPGHHGVSAALEFAVQLLKVREIVVMGHGMCGGCKAALTQDLHGDRARAKAASSPTGSTCSTRRASRVVAEHRHRRARGRARDGAWPAVKVSLANLRTFPCVAGTGAARQAARCAARFSRFPTACSTCSTRTAASSRRLPNRRARGPSSRAWKTTKTSRTSPC